MPNIEVPGYGDYYFPDTLSQDEIMASLKDEIKRVKASRKSYGQAGDFAVNALTGTVKGAGTGIAGLLRMMGADEYADKVKDAADLNKNYELPSGSTGAQWGQMLGSSLGLLGLGSAASLVAGPVGGAAVMGGLGVGGGIERVQDDIQLAHMKGMDLSEDEKFKQRLLGGIIGSTEALPLERVAGKLVRPLMKVIGKGTGEAAEEALKELTQGRTLRGYLKGAGEQAAAEATQSVGSEIGYRALNKSYDPSVDIFKDLGSEAAAGGGIGALMDLALRGAGHVAARRRGIPEAKLSEPVVDDQASEPLGGLVTKGMYGGPGSPDWANASATGGGMYGAAPEKPSLHEQAQAAAASTIDNAARQGYGMYGQQPREAPPGMYGAAGGGLGALAEQLGRLKPSANVDPTTLGEFVTGFRGLEPTPENLAMAKDDIDGLHEWMKDKFNLSDEEALRQTLERGGGKELVDRYQARNKQGPVETLRGMQMGLGEQGLAGSQMNLFGPQQEASLRAAAAADAEARSRAADAAQFAPGPQPGLFGTPALPTQQRLPLGPPSGIAAIAEQVGLPQPQPAPAPLPVPEQPVYQVNRWWEGGTTGAERKPDGYSLVDTRVDPADSAREVKVYKTKKAAEKAAAKLNAAETVADVALVAEAPAVSAVSPVSAAAPVQVVAPEPQPVKPSVAAAAVAPPAPALSPEIAPIPPEAVTAREQPPQPPPVAAAPSSEIRAIETAVPAPEPATAAAPVEIPATPVAAAPAPAPKKGGKIQPAADYMRAAMDAGTRFTAAEVREKFALDEDDFTRALQKLAPQAAAKTAAPAPTPLDQRLRDASDHIRAQIAANQALAPEVVQHRFDLTPEQFDQAINLASGPPPPPPTESKVPGLVKETWKENSANITPEELETFYNRVFRGAGQKPIQVIQSLFGEGRYLDANKALLQMGVTEVGPRAQIQLAFDPTPYVPPKPPPSARVQPAGELSPLAKLAPATDLYSPRQFERVIQMMSDGSTLSDAVLEVFRGRSDAEIHQIQEHMVMNARDTRNANGDPILRPSTVPIYERKGARTTPVAGLAERMGTKWHLPIYDPVIKELAYDYSLQPKFVENFPVGMGTKAPPTELASIRAQIKKLLDPELSKMLGTGGRLKNKTTALELVDNILTTWGTRAEGEWHPSERLMRIALDIAEPGIPIGEQMDRFREVMHHEIIHAARGLFNGGEWKNLVNAAKKGGFVEDAKGRYEGQRGITQMQINEEAVASMFAKGMEKFGERMPAKNVKPLYERFVGFTQRLGNSMRGMGFQTPDDIMQRLASGELAARGQQTDIAPGEGRPKYSLPKQESPWQKIVRGAQDIRAGRDPGHLTNPADLAQARHLAAEQRLDLDRVKNVDPDEHLKIARMGLPDWLANHLRSSVAAEAIRSGRDPKQPIGFDKFSEWARSMMKENEGLDVSKLETHYNQMQSSAAFLGARDALNGLHQQIAKEVVTLEQNRHQMDKPAILAAEAKIETMRNGAQQLTNALLPARSAAGRALAYQRIAAEGSFDSLYWMAQAKRAMNLPGNASLPPEVQADLIKHTVEGKQAEQDARDAKAKGDTAGEKEAQQRVIKAKEGVSKTVSALSKNTGMEALRSLWKAGLLSGPQTQIANFTSNAFMAGLERLSSAPGSWIDAAIGKFTGIRTVANQLDRDAMKASKDAFGSGWKEAQKIAYDTVIKGEAPQAQQDFVNKINLARGVNFGNMPGAKKLEHYVNAIFGMQQAGDAPWSAIAKASELQGVADNIARTEQLQGVLPKGRDALVKRRRELQANPTPEMLAAANDRALYHTFGNDNAASKGAEAFKRSAEKMGPMGQAMATVFDMAVPFVKVPSNVFSAMLQYSPVGLGYATGKGVKQAGQAAWAKARGKEMAAKLTPDDQRMYATLLSRGAVGSAIMALGYMAAKAGIAAGFRDDQDTAGRAADEAVGRPQGSLKVGNRWLQMNRISPVGNLMAIGASLYREGERPLSNPAQRAGNLLGAAAKSMNEMPFMQGMEGLVDAVQNPGKQGGAYLQRQAGSVVPTLLANVAQTIDPVQRELKDQGMGAALQSRVPLARQYGIPGLVNPLPVHKDILGRDVTAPGIPYAGSLVDIFRSRAEREDPLSQAMIESQFGFIRPDKRPGEDQSITLLRQELAGDLARKYLEKAVRSSAYRRAKDDEEQREVLQDALSDSRHDLSRYTGKSNRRYSKATPEQQGAMLNQWLARTQRQLSQ